MRADAGCQAHPYNARMHVFSPCVHLLTPEDDVCTEEGALQKRSFQKLIRLTCACMVQHTRYCIPGLLNVHASVQHWTAMAWPASPLALTAYLHSTVAEALAPSCHPIDGLKHLKAASAVQAVTAGCPGSAPAHNTAAHMAAQPDSGRVL